LSAGVSHGDNIENDRYVAPVEQHGREGVAEVSEPSGQKHLHTRLALASIALALGLGRAAIASEVTTPVEQLHAGLMAIMKAGKTAPFRQRYDMIAPVIGRRWGMPFAGYVLDYVMRQRQKTADLSGGILQ
jgi:hypothetical protein